MIITPRPWPINKRFKNWPPPPPKPSKDIIAERYFKLIEPCFVPLAQTCVDKWNQWEELLNQPWIEKWEVIKAKTFFDRDEVVFWITDEKYTDLVWKDVFGLPTTILLSEQVFDGSPYRSQCHTKETLLKRNFNNIWGKIIFKFKIYWKRDKE